MTEDRRSKMHHEFLLKHERADELIFEKATGFPLRAVYYTYEGLHNRETVRFFETVQRLMAQGESDD